MFTAFSGTVYGAPGWYFIYLGVTQVTPIIVASVTLLVALFTCYSGRIQKKVGGRRLLFGFNLCG